MSLLRRILGQLADGEFDDGGLGQSEFLGEFGEEIATVVAEPEAGWVFHDLKVANRALQGRRVA